MADETVDISGSQSDSGSVSDEAALGLETTETAPDTTQTVSTGDESIPSGGDTTTSTGNEDTNFDAELLSMAAECGFTEQEARDFGTTKQLIKALLPISRRLEQMGQPRQADQAQPAPIKTDDGFKWAIDPEKDGFDPKLVSELNRYHEWNAKRLEAYDKRVGEMSQREQRREAEESRRTEMTRQERFDESLNALGEEYRELFGSGNVNSLKQDSKEWSNRRQVYMAMRVAEKSWRDMGTPVTDSKVLLQQALGMVFHDKQQELARKKVASSLSSRSNSSMSRPSSRKTATNGIGLQPAKEHVRNWMSQRDTDEAALGLDDDES